MGSLIQLIAHWVRVNAGGVMAKHTDAEVEAFSQEYAISGDCNRAYLVAKPNTKAKPDSLYSMASRMAKLPEVVQRVSELKSQAKVKAESRFAITVEQRLKWLRDIVNSGIATYHDQLGNKRRENLAAARAAIATMNDMLGVDDSGGETSQPLSITFNIVAPKAKVETTNVE